jgi:hypothetical protein
VADRKEGRRNTFPPMRNTCRHSTRSCRADSIESRLVNRNGPVECLAGRPNMRPSWGLRTWSPMDSTCYHTPD